MPKNSGRALNREYKEKLVQKVMARAFTKSFLPAPARVVYTAVHSIWYLLKGIRCLLRGKLEVEVLDATAIAVSVLRRDFDTAGSVMFLLGIGELLEEWTHKKSVGDLARSMSLNISRGMAECGWNRGPGPCFKDPGGGPGNGPYGKCDTSGRRGHFRGRHGEPGFHDRRVSAGQEGGGR